MLMPSVFGERLLDSFFDSPRRGHEVRFDNVDLLKTDVKETDEGYELTMNIPGVKKEDVKAELKDGYLTVTASSESSNEDKDEEGRYIRRERFSGSCSRSFYVGEDVTQDEIKAKFENGTIVLSFPKKDVKPAVEENHYINIEG